MSPGRVPEVIDEDRVDERSSCGPDQGQRLGRQLLGYNHAEPCRNPGDQAHQSRRALLAQALQGDVSGRFRNRAGQGGSGRIVPRLRRVFRSQGSDESEDLQAGELRVDPSDVFSFAAGDIGDGTEHNPRGQGEFQRKGGKPQGPSQGSRSRHRDLVEEVCGSLRRPFIQGRHGKIQGLGKSRLGSGLHGARPAPGQELESLLEGKTEEIRDSVSETGLLQEGSGVAQGLLPAPGFRFLQPAGTSQGRLHPAVGRRGLGKTVLSKLLHAAMEMC